MKSVSVSHNSLDKIEISLRKFYPTYKPVALMKIE